MPRFVRARNHLIDGAPHLRSAHPLHVMTQYVCAILVGLYNCLRLFTDFALFTFSRKSILWVSIQTVVELMLQMKKLENSTPPPPNVALLVAPVPSRRLREAHSAG